MATFIGDGRVKERPHGGRNNVKVDEEMKKCLNDIVKENCFLTLKQINEELLRVKLARPVLADRHRSLTAN